MTILNLNINRREYEIACNDGEEQHIVNLSYQLDKRVKDLSKVIGTGNQSLLLVVAALQLLDELHDSKSSGTNPQNLQAEVDRISSAVISQLTDKIEDIAARLERKAS